MRDRKIYTNRYADSIQVYKIIDLKGDTTFVDTTLTIYKYYKLNPLRKDEYGYMPYPNLAEGYTPMVLSQDISLTPQYGARSRSMYYRRTEDIDYYDVRTPWSEVMYIERVFQYDGAGVGFQFYGQRQQAAQFLDGFPGKAYVRVV